MEKIVVKRKSVALWNNTGDDFTITLCVQGIEFRLDMETAFHFAFSLSTLGCGIDPTGGMYTSEDIENFTNISFDLPRSDIQFQDSIYLEKQINGCFVEFTRHDILSNLMQKYNVYLEDSECDYIYLQITDPENF